MCSHVDCLGKALEAALHFSLRVYAKLHPIFFKKLLYHFYDCMGLQKHGMWAQTTPLTQQIISLY